MKKILTTLILVSAILFTAHSQEDDGEIKTIFGSDMESGGYGSFDMKVTPVYEDLGLLLGGKGGWIINHQLIVGGGGYGLTTNSVFNGPGRNGNDTTLNIDMGYGGILFEYSLMPMEPIHLSFPVLIGAGGAGIYEKDVNNDFLDDFNFKQVESSAFVVVEPGVDVEFNLVKYFRMSMGATYRLILGSDMSRVSDNNLSGVSFNLSFKFGIF